MFLSRFFISNLFCAFLIGAILLIKRLLKNKVSLKFHYHIWFTLLLSLMIVFLPASFFQFESLNDITQEMTAPSSNSSDVTDMPDDWRYDFTEIKEKFESIELATVLLIIWGVGVL